MLSHMALIMFNRGMAELKLSVNLRGFCNTEIWMIVFQFVIIIGTCKVVFWSFYLKRVVCESGLDLHATVEAI